ncbi:MAG: sigma-54-dependent Fis family transcriptional regulator [Chitinophagales bacterium]|jgi:DNA-binding NtrC family response regulator|nr:sigma-54-dependent Fis family transcriptional regulator [Bacteroidota bacterium]MBP8915826.1 sigma-54-dependent Fis family transcriptional regulator [Chitinophagales bacterium]MBK7569851.1 sigma-54-dependent Fis family transcriptional regulator [Bacteroidota bacterium]MBP8917414.1 sigma-54-dependent Fis family transcriptional regulator [Chitinophagales bacterium]MBP9219981.1 sigma-54-dependent Fis family transcriptional regulator [Chitinophagales bacterium]
MANILLIDDEKSIRKTLREILEYEGYVVDEASDGSEGFRMIQEGDYDIVLCDIKMPKMDGMEVLEKSQVAHADVPFIMISGHGTLETAVEAVKKGAFDYVAKPPDLNRLLITIRNALDKSNLITETKVLKRRVTKTREIIGDSPAIVKIKETIERVAPTDARVLITGDNGTGKELVARWIHEKSNRANGPLIEVNCAAIPSELIESELFGHEKGAFTSAIKQRIGKFEQANGGTLFLDEIGDMSLSAQAKVLRALQENKITRVGGDKEIPVDVRVVAATNKDLIKEVDANQFRIDLYHRISVILIHVPSLNDRTDDIPLLSERFVKEICEDYGIPKKVITPKAMMEIMNVNFTGNIRELRNVIERLVILSEQKITEEDVINYAQSPKSGGSPKDLYERFEKFQDFKDHIEKEFILHRLNKNGWNVSKTAEELDIQRSHLYNKIEKYNLKRD